MNFDNFRAALDWVHADPVGADAMGTQGKEHVRANFLATRELEDWVRLLTELRA